MIKEQFHDGEHLVEITTSTWTAKIVVSNNANMISLRHEPTGIDILRTPESMTELRKTPERYGIPLLFPPGRIDGGKFRWNGRDYIFPLNEPENNCNLHGLLCGASWKLTETMEDETGVRIKMTLDFNPDHPYYAGFPHEFRVELTYHFTDDAVHQKTTVFNCGKEEMPLGIGYHTAFRLPSEPCRIMVTTANQRWEMSDPRRLPTGRLIPLTNDERFNVPGGRDVGIAAVGMLCPAVTQNGFRGAVITSCASGTEIIYEVDEAFSLWALWNDGGDKGFFCVEPLTWLSNAPNLNLPPEATGLHLLSPGDARRCQGKIMVR